jgi:hypothetical protein
MSLPGNPPSWLVTLGTVGGVPIVADLGLGLYPGATVKITLTADYARSVPPGYPIMTPAGRSYQYPPIISAGWTDTFLEPEALALVQAGAAEYA